MVSGSYYNTVQYDKRNYAVLRVPTRHGGDAVRSSAAIIASFARGAPGGAQYVATSILSCWNVLNMPARHASTHATKATTHHRLRAGRRPARRENVGASRGSQGAESDTQHLIAPAKGKIRLRQRSHRQTESAKNALRGSPTT